MLPLLRRVVNETTEVAYVEPHDRVGSKVGAGVPKLRWPLLVGALEALEASQGEEVGSGQDAVAVAIEDPEEAANGDEASDHVLLGEGAFEEEPAVLGLEDPSRRDGRWLRPVSYTHLTLPTICSV
eukprot:5500042-Alexandrium_andersonii.AAC.1